MCGIIGSIQTKFDIRNALSKIKHRGPDADGIFENDNIQFGHVRLSVIDLTQSANQPFLNEDISLVLIFNGEIYNYKNLRSKLNSFYQFKTQSDTEVLLKGLEKFGINFVEQLQGMFAFAYHDCVEKITYIVRDRFGIKPLYYRKKDRGFLFGSEIKAIRQEKFTHCLINQARLADFIYHRRLDHTNQTFFNDIYQIPPGTYLRYDHKTESSKIIRYYQIPCIGNGNNSFSAHELKAKICETVKSHIQADVEVGSFLSGGLDSSVISHVMTTGGAGETTTLSARTVCEHAENKLIDNFLAQHENVNSIQFKLDGEHFYNEIFNVIYYHDEPILDGSVFSHYMLCKKANQNGMKVVLSGSGGDEVFGGYESHSIGILSDLLTIKEFPKFIQCLTTYTRFHRKNIFNVFIRVVFEFFSENFKENVRVLNRKRNLLNILISKERLNQKCISNTAKAFERSLKYQTIPPYLHYEDRNGMAFGVEIRVPFLDHKLVEYIAGLSRDSLFDGKTKSSLRDAFMDDISDEIILQRSKEGFPSPIDTALRSDQRLRIFFYRQLNNTPFLNVEECKLLADEFYLKGENLTVFWRILSYMIWFRVQETNNVNPSADSYGED